MSVHFSSASNEWSTPKEFYNILNNEFYFNLDPCSTKENAKCDTFLQLKMTDFLNIGSVIMYL